MAIIVADYQQLLEDFRAMIRHEMQSAPTAVAAQQPASDDLLTIKDAAAMLGISVATVHEHKRTGRLPYTKLGGRAYIKRSDVLAAGTQHQRSAKPNRSKKS
jgi:excisionase family DNA binding protein